jgi:formyl-CoA transferase
MAGALSHVRVLDLSRVLAGPWASQVLADLGAEVIKIERPGSGDDTRSWGPPYLKDREGRATQEAAYYLCANRAKKSVTLDIATQEGQAIIRRLAAGSDILLENYKVGALRRYGLDYESLRAINPRLIYCSITGFGQSGPYAERAGYDFIIQGLGGLMSITGERDELTGGGPQKVGVAVADLMTGMYAAVGVLAALVRREVSGEGQHVDLALLDVQVAMLANISLNYLVSGKLPQRWGNAHANIVPYQVFGCRDGHIILAVGNDAQFRRFCNVAGCDELAADARFATNSERVRNRTVLVPLLAEIMLRRDAHDWLAALEAADVPCGPINDLEQVFSDPQVHARGLRVDVPHPLSGTVPQVANPILLSATPIGYGDAPPTLGQHTREVLREILGMDEGELAELARKGVI